VQNEIIDAGKLDQAAQRMRDKIEARGDTRRKGGRRDVRN
jgi:hypothetical protein